MAGVSAVSMIGYMNNISVAYGGQKLSAATKAKLEALGVDTRNIKTEAEGKMKLREIQIEGTNIVSGTKNTKKEVQVDEALNKARARAYKLNVSYSDHDNVDDIVYKIKVKIEEMFKAAGEDNDKKANAAYYAGLLEEVKQMQQSKLTLSLGMNISANMNIAFHGLY